jgi:vesicle-fusing ATPase
VSSISSPFLCRYLNYPLSHDNTNKIQRGTVGTSAAQRQWIGLSVTGDQVTLDLLPPPPHPAAPLYLQSLDVQVEFLRRGLEIAEQFSADEMTKTFLRGYGGVVMARGQVIVFEFHGQNLKGTITSISVLELADEQRRGAAASQRSDFGIVMDKTDVSFIKAPNSLIKIKSSAKKLV